MDQINFTRGKRRMKPFERRVFPKYDCRNRLKAQFTLQSGITVGVPVESIRIRKFPLLRNDRLRSGGQEFKGHRSRYESYKNHGIVRNGKVETRRKSRSHCWRRYESADNSSEKGDLTSGGRSYSSNSREDDSNEGKHHKYHGRKFGKEDSSTIGSVRKCPKEFETNRRTNFLDTYKPSTKSRHFTFKSLKKRNERVISAIKIKKSEKPRTSQKSKPASSGEEEFRKEDHVLAYDRSNHQSESVKNGEEVDKNCVAIDSVLPPLQSKSGSEQTYKLNNNTVACIKTESENKFNEPDANSVPVHLHSTPTNSDDGKNMLGVQETQAKNPSGYPWPCATSKNDKEQIEALLDALSDEERYTLQKFFFANLQQAGCTNELYDWKASASQSNRNVCSVQVPGQTTNVQETKQVQVSGTTTHLSGSVMKETKLSGNQQQVILNGFTETLSSANLANFIGSHPWLMAAFFTSMGYMQGKSQLQLPAGQILLPIPFDYAMLWGCLAACMTGTEPGENATPTETLVGRAITDEAEGVLSPDECDKVVEHANASEFEASLVSTDSSEVGGKVPSEKSTNSESSFEEETYNLCDKEQESISELEEGELSSADSCSMESENTMDSFKVHDSDEDSGSNLWNKLPKIWTKRTLIDQLEDNLDSARVNSVESDVGQNTDTATKGDQKEQKDHLSRPKRTVDDPNESNEKVNSKRRKVESKSAEVKGKKDKISQDRSRSYRNKSERNDSKAKDQSISNRPKRLEKRRNSWSQRRKVDKNQLLQECKGLKNKAGRNVTKAANDRKFWRQGKSFWGRERQRRPPATPVTPGKKLPSLFDKLELGDEPVSDNQSNQTEVPASLDTGEGCIDPAPEGQNQPCTSTEMQFGMQTSGLEASMNQNLQFYDDTKPNATTEDKTDGLWDFKVATYAPDPRLERKKLFSSTAFTKLPAALPFTSTSFDRPQAMPSTSKSTEQKQSEERVTEKIKFKNSCGYHMATLDEYQRNAKQVPRKPVFPKVSIVMPFEEMVDRFPMSTMCLGPRWILDVLETDEAFLLQRETEAINQKDGLSKLRINHEGYQACGAHREKITYRRNLYSVCSLFYGAELHYRMIDEEIAMACARKAANLPPKSVDEIEVLGNLAKKFIAQSSITQTPYSFRY